MTEETFNLMKARIDEAKRDMAGQLNRELFSNLTAYGYTPRPLTRREQFTRGLASVRGYFWTLWQALKGRAPYDGWYE